jgi:hypothetical protein
MLASQLPDWVITHVYERLVSQKLNRWLFLSGEVTNEDEFKQLVRSKNALFYFVIDTEEQALAGVFWLNGRTSINCGLHMAVFKEYWGRSVQIGKECLEWVFNAISGLESLLSFIPDTNRSAKQYALKTGWIAVGSVPRLIKDVYTGDIVSGTMFYVTREVT